MTEQRLHCCCFLSLLKSGKMSLSGDKSNHLALLVILQKALFILIIASYKNHQSKNEQSETF